MARRNQRTGRAARSARFTALGLAFAGACASSEVPAKDLADSEAAVRTATELGAKGTPEAALHLQMAKDRLERAKSLNEKGEGDSAKTLLEEAKADAELAVVLTRENEAELDAKKAGDRLSNLNRSNDSSQTSQPGAPAPASEE